MTQAVLFPLGREGFLAGEIDANTAVIKMNLIRGYTYDAADKFTADLASMDTASEVTLAGISITQGVFDATDTAFVAVPTGAACTALIIYQASAVTGGGDVARTAQRLIAYIDNATGLPVTPNGDDVNIVFDNGTNKIFKL